jgi:predicted negative regulator of RcsB-dependent stress response
MFKKDQRGLGVVEVILILVLAGLLAFIGFRVWQVYGGDWLGDNASKSQQASRQKQEQAPEINNKEDLKKTEDFLTSDDLNQELNTEEFDKVLK